MEKDQVERYLAQTTTGDLFREFPYVANMFEAIRLDVPDESMTVLDVLGERPDESFTDYGFTKATFAASVIDFIERYGFPTDDPIAAVESITVLGGTDKDGRPERCSLTVRRGEIVCIVGPTGSGKSRLLADIETLAQGDTPSGRHVLVNGETPSWDMRFALDNRLVAQITQNMNFVIDLSVEEFVRMHVESRTADDDERSGARQGKGGKAGRDPRDEELDRLVGRVIACANDLSGEPFAKDAPVTQLSGGQSRALMVADAALLCASPVILIDEIENAGIDRTRAFDLLTGEGKIVLLSTHDPVLALSGSRRAVIENGAVTEVLECSEDERRNLACLRLFDSFLLDLRDRLRKGGRLDGDVRRQLEEALAGLDGGDGQTAATGR